LKNYLKDLTIFKENFINLKTFWDGKECILELKDADYNWKQMEWWGFYFEYLITKSLKNESEIEIQGQKINNVKFDLSGNINWDIKASAIKSDNHKIILNDKIAMEKSIELNGYHGEIIGLCDVEYNDEDRTFQKWHTKLKGGKSKYEKAREVRTSISRYRKTKANLIEIIFVIFKKSDLYILDIMKQGRNSNGAKRKEKYMLNLEMINKFNNSKIEF